MPVVAFVNGATANTVTASRNAAAFSKGLSETGYVEGQNVRMEFYWLEGHYDRLPACPSARCADHNARQYSCPRLQRKLQQHRSRLSSVWPKMLSNLGLSRASLVLEAT